MITEVRVSLDHTGYGEGDPIAISEIPPTITSVDGIYKGSFMPWAAFHKGDEGWKLIVNGAPDATAIIKYQT